MTAQGLVNPRVIHLDSDRIRLVSFDVFDTAIARRCGDPEAIFRLTGERLRKRGLISLSARVFQRLRVEAERRRRRHRGTGEITLAEIYAELNRVWFFPETVVQAMAESELQVERENLFAIPGALTLVEQARRAGKRVAFISDMYLPPDFLQRVLVELGLFKPGDHLYVSSQWNRSKADGGLFRIVLKEEKLSGREVLHLGDSRYSDGERAVEAGIQTCPIMRGALNRFELALAKAEADGQEDAGPLAGLARAARLKADETGEHFVAARLGASLAGPLLTSYAEWLLRGARERKLKRLYFLARDGEAILRVCESLASALGAGDIELRYLHGSRGVWSAAGLETLDQTAAEFFARQVAWTASTWEHCVEYLGFTADELRRTAWPGKWASARREGGWKQQVLLDVAADSELGPVLKRRLQERVSLSARYLREQGLADAMPCGLVDCGWSGTWTGIIGSLAEREGGTKPLVFFLGRRKRAGADGCETLGWMFDQQNGSGLTDIPDFFHVVVEFLLTANHGRTVGFEETEGRLRARLGAVDWQGFTPEDWLVFRRAMLGFAGAYARQAGPRGQMADLRPALNEMVRLFWEEPTVDEARFFAGHTIGLSPSRANSATLARPYRWTDALRLALRGRLPGYPPFWWHEGALALSGASLRIGMGFMWEARGMLRRALREGKSGRSVPALMASVRRLKRAFEWREDFDSCRMEGPGEPAARLPQALDSLAVAASPGATNT